MRSDDRVRGQDHPTFGHGRLPVPPGIHRARTIRVRGRGDNQNRPALPRIEARGKHEQGAATVRPRIPSSGRVILEIWSNRKLNLERASRLHRLPGQEELLGVGREQRARNREQEKRAWYEPPHI